MQLVLKDRGLDLTTQPVSPQLQMEMAREAAKNQPHGGAANKADKVDKHEVDQTGQQDGRPPIAPAQPMPAAPPMVQ